VNTYGPHPAPPCGEREILWRAIVDQSREIGARVQDASEEEIDALLEEAFADCAQAGLVRRRAGLKPRAG